MNKERKKKILYTITTVTTTAFAMTLIYGYIVKVKTERWEKSLDHYKKSYVETIIIEDKSSQIDSIITRGDTTFYFKNDTLISHSIRTKK